MNLDLKNTYFKDIDEVKELSKHFGWKESQIRVFGSNKLLLKRAREIKENGA